MKRLAIIAIIFSSFYFAGKAPGQILAEAFRSIGCTNCIDIDKGYEQFVKSNPNLNVQIVYFHNLIASFDDPFYKIAKSDVDARMGIYSVQSDPILFVTGFNAGAGGDQLSNWESYTSNPAASNYPASLTATAMIDNTGKLVVTLHASGSSG